MKPLPVQAFIQPFIWQLERLARTMGLPGWIACGLLLLSAAAWLGLIQPARHQAEKLEQDIATLQREIQQNGKNLPTRATTPSDQLEQFQQHFSSGKDATASLVIIEALARREGLQLSQAEFKLAAQTEVRLLRYSIILPVKSDYRTLRSFIRAVLKDLPGIALEEVSLRRDDSRSNLLEGRLRFVLYLSGQG